MSGVEGLVRAWCVRVGVGRYWLVRAWCVRVGVGRHCLVQASSPCLGAAPRAPFFISVSAGCEPLLWRGWGFGCRSVTAQGQTGGRAEGVLLGPALHIVHRRAALPPPTAAPSTPGHSPHETRAHSQATRCTRPHPPHTRPHSPGPSEVAEGAGRHVPRPPARRSGRGRGLEVGDFVGAGHGGHVGSGQLPCLQGGPVQRSKPRVGLDVCGPAPAGTQAGRGGGSKQAADEVFQLLKKRFQSELWYG